MTGYLPDNVRPAETASMADLFGGHYVSASRQLIDELAA